MADQDPTTILQTQYSSPGAPATPWTAARAGLEQAAIYWLTTVRPDGRPHVTPLIAVWLEGALFFCTGPEEQKARNLARSPFCTLTTGCNAIGEGLDIVVEGEAANVRDHPKLERIAGAYVAKYGSDWRVE